MSSSTAMEAGSRVFATSHAHREHQQPSGRINPRHPIVFCHGMLGMSLLHGEELEGGNYFTCIRSHLDERGIRGFFPAVSGIGAVAERASQLREQIQSWTDEPVNLIAHSMGGLDARYMIAHLGMAKRVRSLTTLGTPHRGTPAADWFCSGLGRFVLPLAKWFGLDVRGLNDCTTAACRDFNARTVDHPAVRYFSVAAVAPMVRVSSLLRRSWSVIRAKEGDNDGLVSLQSARWGEFLGTLSIDHFTMTPDGLFRHPCERFEAGPFYDWLFDELFRRGL